MDMILANGDWSKYSSNALNHPIQAAKILSRTHNAVSREVIRAVEQHHELPSGKGYPTGIKGLSIDQLSALTIIARKFIDKLVDTNFAYDDRRVFIDELLADFTYPNFVQPCKDLYKIMGLETEEK
jgi:hypothetical protein